MNVLALVLAYLIGAVPFAWILVRRVVGTDVRLAGSGNMGATNVLRVTRPALGLTVMALDIGKGAAAVTAARAVGAGDTATAAAAAVAVVGHMFPVWIGFRGGKGVATAGGAFAVLAPAPTSVAMALFGAIVYATRYVSLGSLVAAAALPLLIVGAGGAPAVAVAGLVASGLVWVRHRGNIARLVAGTERRLVLRPSAVRRHQP